MATNPYGSLGPSPSTVRKVNSTLGRTPLGLPKPKPTVQPQDPYAGINASVDAILQGLLSQVQREQDAARKQYEQDSQWELDKANALAQGLQQLGISQAVQSAFQNAGQAQAGLAQGFSGATRDAASAAAADQMRQLSGTGQEGAVRNQGEAMGNVQYGLHGYIPATELNQTGAAFGAQAALQPGFAMQFGQIEASKRRQEMLEALEKFAGQKEEILGKRPELFMDLLDEQRGYQMDLRKQSLAERKAAQTAKNNEAKLKLARQKEKFDQAEAGVRLSQGQQRISQTQASLELRARQYAQTNAQAWARIGVSDKNAQVSASRNELAWKKYKSGGSIKSGITSAQAQRFRRDAGKIASDAWATGQQLTGLGKTAADAETLGITVASTYQQAMREGLARGIPLSVMQTALNSYWKKAGAQQAWEVPGSGRPKVPYQLRNPKPIKNASGVDESNPIVRDALEAGPLSRTKYVYGGSDPATGYDCSGFTMDMVAKHTGIQLPHNAAAQFNDPRGKSVPTPALQPGDVVFFRSSPNPGSSQPPWHNGYYIGGGKYVEYYSAGKPARVSRLSSRKDYMGARRFGS